MHVRSKVKKEEKLPAIVGRLIEEYQWKGPFLSVHAILVRPNVHDSM